MSRRLNMLLCIVGVFGVVCCFASATDLFDIRWYTIDGGGEMFSTGGNFELSGTIGQSDAGMTMSGGQFELAGGFWPGVVPRDVVPVPGDLDFDGDVDIYDFEILNGCLTGPEVVYPVNCDVADLDMDGNVDLEDFAMFQEFFDGPHP